MSNLAERVCKVLEFEAMHFDDLTEEGRVRFALDVYRYTHIARNPSCVEHHQDWLLDFEQHEAAVLAAGAAPRPARNPDEPDPTD